MLLNNTVYNGVIILKHFVSEWGCELAKSGMTDRVGSIQARITKL